MRRAAAASQRDWQCERAFGMSAEHNGEGLTTFLAKAMRANAARHEE